MIYRIYSCIGRTPSFVTVKVGICGWSVYRSV